MALLNVLEDSPTTWTVAKEEGLKDALQDGTATINVEALQVGGVAITSTPAEINILDGATLTTTELNYVDGVTSAIQTQLDGKASSSHTHTASDVTDFTTEVQAISINNVSEDTTPTLGGTLDADGNNITGLGDITFQTGATGGTLRTGTSNADKWILQAYDVDGSAYVDLMEADAGNNPVMQLFVDYFNFEDATDNTKIMKIDASGITTGTTRTLTIPDASGTIELEGHTHATTDITSGTFADARIAQSNVTQHQAALSITESQISDLGAYITGITGEPIQDLSNVTITSLGADELLFTQDGTTWINQTLAEAGIAAASHTHTVSDITNLDNELANLSAAEIDYLEALYATGVTSTEFDYLDGVTSNIQTQLGTKLANVSVDTTPSLGGTLDANSQDITNIELAEFEQEVDNGNSGTADTINWGAGNNQKSTLTGNVTFTFTAPSGPARLQLKLIQDAGGTNTVTWPATVKWPGGTAPTISSGANDVDIVTFWYDGTNYYGVVSQDFS